MTASWLHAESQPHRCQAHIEHFIGPTSMSKEACKSGNEHLTGNTGARNAEVVPWYDFPRNLRPGPLVRYYGMQKARA
ncbi:uncharacterized protein GLRG_00197 [Colletotrichum graminicola M1.001]|uniref:Uncharacterized protein n=1 Tax=Colletotrichum graminicola (strain M1.001 / M2 / FGSC 10212) TaxID=645133 RepID=E3Q374_COLGM|nr:uncharacterized protein GLRG_00197 [Colletotrichum graminicola M1.001]EFQ25053.1 hypothetical protein GLRG_00197 [Colletotrichum graminicola M1.001]